TQLSRGLHQEPLMGRPAGRSSSATRARYRRGATGVNRTARRGRRDGMRGSSALNAIRLLRNTLGARLDRPSPHERIAASPFSHPQAIIHIETSLPSTSEEPEAGWLMD